MHLLSTLKGVNIYGIDVLIKKIKKAKKNLSGCNLIAGDAHTLPFRASNFDLVVLREVLEHLETPIVALKEIRRVLRKGGTIIASTPSWFGLIAPLYLLKKKIMGMQVIDNWWTPFLLTKVLKKSGFKIRSIQIPCTLSSRHAFSIWDIPGNAAVWCRGFDRCIYPFWGVFSARDTFGHHRRLWG